ncbi:hypothetical protein LCGC14_2663240, partial [marine sediment metagenome]
MSALKCRELREYDMVEFKASSHRYGT